MHVEGQAIDGHETDSLPKNRSCCARRFSHNNAPEVGGWAVPDTLEKLAHLVEFGILGALLWLSLHASGMAPPRAFLSAVVLALAIAVTDEGIQSRLPDRQASLSDVGADIVGAAIAAWALSWIATRRARAAS